MPLHCLGGAVVSVRHFSKRMCGGESPEVFVLSYNWAEPERFFFFCQERIFALINQNVLLLGRCVIDFNYVLSIIISPVGRWILFFVATFLMQPHGAI